MKRTLLRLFPSFIVLLATAYWFLFRPKMAGAKIILTRGSEILFVVQTYVTGYRLPGGGINKGEVPEEAIRREVREELGITLGDITYLDSFFTDAEYKRDTVYVFTAELPEEPLTLDDVEIASVHWFHSDNLPRLSPLTMKMIEIYRKGKTKTAS